jgi:hypothetical protein
MSKLPLLLYTDEFRYDIHICELLLKKSNVIEAHNHFNYFAVSWPHLQCTYDSRYIQNSKDTGFSPPSMHDVYKCSIESRIAIISRNLV